MKPNNAVSAPIMPAPASIGRYPGIGFQPGSTGSPWCIGVYPLGWRGPRHWRRFFFLFWRSRYWILVMFGGMIMDFLLSIPG